MANEIRAVHQPLFSKEQRRLALALTVLPLLAGAAALALSYLLTPRYTASTSFLPPQQQQSGTASALAALGSLGALAGVSSAAARTPADQYVALMQSVTVSDRIIDTFKLMEVYRAKLRVDARRSLASAVRISTGKKDGLIRIDVTDSSAQRAADMSNQYVAELRRMTGSLAITEAQQRRVFFQSQLQSARDGLSKAQVELQSSGFNPGALKAEPKAAAEAYARLKAEVADAELRVQALRGRLVDSAPEVRQALGTLGTLRQQLLRAERTETSAVGPDYISRYREFKYQEALFEVYARQFELARVDESREGALIQVVDAAAPPEMRSFPRRTFIAMVTTLGTFAAMVALLFVRKTLRRSRAEDGNATVP